MFSNQQNLQFYENGSSLDLKKGGELVVGLSSSPDISNLIKVLNDFSYVSNSIIEVGAGEGRVVDAFLNMLPGCRLIAVERCEEYLERLNEKHGKNPNVDIIEGDVLTENLPATDISLLSFSVFCEFSRGEQKFLIEKLLNVSRFAVIIDLPDPASAAKREKTAEIGGGEFICDGMNGEKLHLYLPSESDLESYRSDCGASKLTKHYYITDTGRQRLQCVFHQRQDS